jgi:protein gp37
MSDLWHELVPDEYIDSVFEVMALTPRHQFQILTKRPERMVEWLEGAGERWAREPLPNVWLGVSIENDRWTGRADLLRRVPAAVRFISAEPLLAPLPSLNLVGIDWIIVGGESGIGARPVQPEWIRDLRDRSVAAGVKFFFKQWGGRTPKAGGRELDGRTWDEYPEGSGGDPGERARPRLRALRPIPAQERDLVGKRELRRRALVTT